MPNNGPFTTSLKIDLKTKGLSYEKAAELINMSRRQFARYVRGENKIGMMPIETVAELRKKGVISEATTEEWWVEAKIMLMHKKRPRLARRALRKIATLLYHK